MAKKPQRGWTTTEINYLLDNAGKSSVQEIATYLNRTEDSVRNYIKRLRKQGVKVSARRFKSKLHICPSCGFKRSQFQADGICKVCNYLAKADYYERMSAEILSKQSQDDRLHYDKAEVLRGARKKINVHHKKNPPKRARGKLDMSYISQRDQEQIILEEEARQLVIAKREYQRKARRYERIVKKFGNSQKK